MPKLNFRAASLAVAALLAAAAWGTATGPASAADQDAQQGRGRHHGVRAGLPRGRTRRHRAFPCGRQGPQRRLDIDGMVPDGGATWKGGLSKDVDVTFDVEGVYGVRCVPHHAMGMVALIVVGDPSVNLEAARQVEQPGRAKQRMAGLLDRLN